MKRVFSVSLGEDTISKIEEILERGSFRNKSHVVEEAIIHFFGRGGKDE